MTKLLTAEQVAERLDMKLEWVWAQARKGAIPSVKLGRYRAIPRGDDRGLATRARGQVGEDLRSVRCSCSTRQSLPS